MTLYEYYNIADPAMTWVHDAFWQGQTFTPQKAHTITSVKLFMYRHGSPGNGTVSIKATDGPGHPTGEDLCSGSFQGDDLVDKWSAGWVEVDFGAGAALTEGVKYAIVARLAGGDQNNYVRWRSSKAAPYTRGAHEFSSDTGASFDTDAGKDMMFKEYGSPPE